MVAAAIGAAAIGQVLDGGLLIVIFATSGALEAVATHRTAQAVRGLLDLAPDRAVRLLADGTEESVDAAALDAGDVVLVRPGERIAADGQVLDGSSEVDQATITGEPLPVPKQPGDEVFAGTLNGTGALTVRVEPGRRRQRDRPDRGDGGGGVGDQGPHPAVHREGRAALLPGHGRRHGAAVRRPAARRRGVPGLAAARDDVHDRRLAVRGGPGHDAAAACRDGQRRPARRAGQVRRRHGEGGGRPASSRSTRPAPSPREHPGWPPSGPARRRAWPSGTSWRWPRRPRTRPSTRWAARSPPPRETQASTLDRPTEFTALPGRGVTAVVAGHTVEIGSPRTCLPHADRAVDEAVAELEERRPDRRGHADRRQPAAVLGIADRIRPAAATAAAEITRLTGAPPVLLTGDNQRAAARLAAQVGITDVRAGLLPEDKVRAVRELEAAGRNVLLAGDGVNDAPALAAASTGDRDGPGRFRPGPRHRRHRHHARRPDRHPGRHRACPAAPAASSPRTW